MWAYSVEIYSETSVRFIYYYYADLLGTGIRRPVVGPHNVYIQCRSARAGVSAMQHKAIEQQLTAAAD